MSATYNNQVQPQWGVREELVGNSQKLSLSFLFRMGSSLIETLASSAPFSLLAQGTSSISARTEQTLRQLIACRVLIPSPSEVRSYLIKHSDLLDVLPSLCEDVSCRFGSSTKLSLEYYQDPQFENDQYLCLYVKSTALDQSLVEDIDNITDAYSEAFKDVKGWVLITPDFRPF